jgi:hypothetical protein
MYGDEVCDYWINKGKIPLEEIHSIDWINSEKAIKRLPFSRQLWISKFSSGHCAVGRMMKIRKEWTHDKCPLCLEDNETNDHVLLCQDPRALQQWDTLATKLDKDLQNMTTATTIRRTIMRKLHNWRRKKESNLNLTNEYGERAASIAQDRIGWTNFMLGRISGEWACAQQDYLDYLGRRKTGKRWLIALTTKLLNISWDLWDYRNSILHHKDHPWKQLEQAAANERIDEEYDQGPLNLDQGEQWLRRTSQQVKELPMEAKQQWIRSVELARVPYDRDTVQEYRAMQHERRAMAEWLNPQQAATNPETNNHAEGPTEATPTPAGTKRRRDEQASARERTKRPRGDQPEEEIVETSDREASPQRIRKKRNRPMMEKEKKRKKKTE